MKKIVILLIILMFLIMNSYAALLTIGDYGFIDKTGKLVIKQKYSHATDFKDGLALVSDNRGKSLFINASGKVVIDTGSFGRCEQFSEGLASVILGSGTRRANGFIDKAGKVVIKPQFDDAFGFNEGLAMVRIDSKWGYINKTGKIVIDNQFDSVGPFSEGIAAVMKWDKDYKPLWGYINKSRQYIVKPSFKSAIEFHEGIAGVMIEDKNGNTKWGFINNIGKMVIAPQFEDIKSFKGGIANVKYNGQWQYIDKEGKINNINIVLKEGLLPFSIKDKNGDEKWGYKDSKGKVIVEPKYFQATEFSEGLAAVNVSDSTLSGKWGFIDKKGDMVITPQFEYVYGFHDGLCRIANNTDVNDMSNEEGINRENKLIIFSVVILVLICLAIWFLFKRRENMKIKDN